MIFTDKLSEHGIILNDAQLKAVQRTDGATLVLAVPGSGKTTTVIARAGYMICDLDINPQNMLCLTYTRAAVRMMKEKYIELFGDDRVPEFRTIHSLCAKILRYFENKTGRTVFRLAESSELYSILFKILCEDRKHPPTEREMSDIQSAITRHRNMMTEKCELSDVFIGKTNLQKAYKAYDAMKKAAKIMDHDDQLIYAYRVLCTYHDILDVFREQSRYIIVDEAQDVSVIQHKIIKLLSTDSVFMVGDEDQSIYSFRGAYPDALLSFRDDYEDAEVIPMEINYRSTKAIVEFSENFIKHNSKRYDKGMKAHYDGYGEKPRLIELYDFSSVYPYMEALCSSTDAQTAVLYRTNDCALPLVDFFERKGLPYTLLGSDAALFGSRAVKKTIAIFRFLIDMHNEDYFLQVYSALHIGITKETAQKAVEIHRTEGDRTLPEIILSHKLVNEKNQGRASVFLKIMKKTDKYTSYGFLRFIDEHFFAYQLSEGAESNIFNVMLAISVHYPEKKDFLSRMYELDSITHGHVNPSEGTKITLSTVHSAKGLEFDRVVLIDVKPGQMPNLTSLQIKNEEYADELEEERRLFYVACTRAKRELMIFTSDCDNNNPIERSLFIYESFNIEPPKAIVKKDKPSFVPKVSENRQKVKGAVLPKDEQDIVRKMLAVGVIVRDIRFGDGKIIDMTDTVIRLRLFRNKKIVPINIEAALKNGWITIVEN